MVTFTAVFGSKAINGCLEVTCGFLCGSRAPVCTWSKTSIVFASHIIGAWLLTRRGRCNLCWRHDARRNVPSFQCDSPQVRNYMRAQHYREVHAIFLPMFLFLFVFTIHIRNNSSRCGRCTVILVRCWVTFEVDLQDFSGQLMQWLIDSSLIVAVLDSISGRTLSHVRVVDPRPAVQIVTSLRPLIKCCAICGLPPVQFYANKFAKKWLLASLCLTVRMELIDSHWTDFREILYLSIFTKICRHSLVLVKTMQK
jgi:hypothetical protein